jgi:hypothetical protein
MGFSFYLQVGGAVSARWLCAWTRRATVTRDFTQWIEGFDREVCGVRALWAVMGAADHKLVISTGAVWFHHPAEWRNLHVVGASTTKVLVGNPAKFAGIGRAAGLSTASANNADTGRDDKFGVRR